MSHDPSEDDKKLFRDAMRSVTPLKTRALHQPTRSDKTPPLIHKKPYEPVIEHRYLSNHYTDEVGSESILTYAASGIPKKQLIKLKRGEIRWQARIDLHGQTISQAQTRLCQFITQQYDLGNRCVLVIHGKGGSTGEAPILKNHTNHWLKQLPEVLAFHSALPRDGGAGALYVLLKQYR